MISNLRLSQLVVAVRAALIKSFYIEPSPSDEDVIKFMQHLNDESATVALIVHEHDDIEEKEAPIH